MGTIITIAIQKGGSAKTSTAVNLASALACKGNKVLLIDTDSQGNAGQALGVVDDDKNIAAVLGGQCQLSEAIRQVGNLDLLPSASILSTYENALTAQANVFAIKQYITDAIKSQYDYVIIDTPPSDGVIVRNALVASDYALIPCQAQTFALKGLQRAIKLIETVRQHYNPSLQLIGILPTMLQLNTNMGTLVIKQLQQDYGKLVTPFAVPLTVKVTESQLIGMPLIEYEANNPASRVYNQLANMIDSKVREAQK